MVIVVALGVTGCASLPPLEGRTETHTPRGYGRYAPRKIHRAARRGPFLGKTGIHALPNPLEAFAARAVLAAVAEKSLDVQYYIWRDDQTGYLLFDALWRAAERGVRVRLLLDDNNTKGLDEVIGVLDEHPNIEVRLYNPVAYRSSRLMNFVTDFERVNRRMHNKSFTADKPRHDRGRPQHRERYFGAGEDVLFADHGRAGDRIGGAGGVQRLRSLLEQSFGYPAKRVVPKVAPDARDRLKAKFVRGRRRSRVPASTRTPCGRRHSYRSSSKADSPSNGTTPASCATTPPRHSTPPSATTCC